MTDDFAGVDIAGLDNEGLDIDGLDNGGLDIDGLDIAGPDIVGLDSDQSCNVSVPCETCIRRCLCGAVKRVAVCNYSRLQAGPAIGAVNVAHKLSADDHSATAAAAADVASCRG